MNAKQAIAKAKTSVADLFENEGVHDIRLEEIRFDDVPSQWLVTVGFLRGKPSSGTILDKIQPEWRREYKVVAISNSTEEAVSVTIRSLD